MQISFILLFLFTFFLILHSPIKKSQYFIVGSFSPKRTFAHVRYVDEWELLKYFCSNFFINTKCRQNIPKESQHYSTLFFFPLQYVWLYEKNQGVDFHYYRPLLSNESATTVPSKWLPGKWSSCFGKCSQGNIANFEESLKKTSKVTFANNERKTNN